MNTAEKFKMIRMALGFSQRALGKEFKVDQSAINKIEQGVNKLSRDIESKLIAYCEKENFYIGTKGHKIKVTHEYLFAED